MIESYKEGKMPFKVLGYNPDTDLFSVMVSRRDNGLNIVKLDYREEKGEMVLKGRFWPDGRTETPSDRRFIEKIERSGGEWAKTYKGREMAQSY